MSPSQYEKYAVRKPIYGAGPGYEGHKNPTMTFMSTKQVPEANHYIELRWISELSPPNPYIYEHVHEYDEIMLHWGGNPDIPQVLGGEIELYIGGQPITFNTTSSIFIPKGTAHGPLTWKKFEFPHIEMAMMLGRRDPFKGSGESGIRKTKSTPPEKTKNFDYEQYVVRSPMREAGRGFRQGRQSPTMTYMSRTQVNLANYYIEFGWIWGKIEQSIPPMTHKKFDEIVLHIGGDPKDPEELGGTMQFGMGEDLLTFDKSYAMYIPRGLKHGPLIWQEVHKPFVEMAIMLDCGTMQEGWGDSFEKPAGIPPVPRI